MWKFFTILALVTITDVMRADNPGDEVIVVYNSRLPESKSLAEYYAAKRGVPAGQIFGFSLTTNEEISRAEFQNSLQKPLAKQLEAKKLWRISSEILMTTNGQRGKVIWKVKESKIRYAVLCYGIPLRIPNDGGIKEDIDSIRPELRRNEAAVDSELSLLPWIEQKLTLTGPQMNPCYTVTNSAALHPTNGILMVTRLDGPSAAIARGLIDKSLAAETNGLCGRAYFDVRNVPTNSAYALGDEWIRGASKVTQFFGGYDMAVDEYDRTFPADFPMSQIAIYCGWYDGRASGPFAEKNVEFMPGAFAYHLHSFSAATIRSTTENWVGPLLAKGATATMGSVAEPYLSGTPDMAVFCARWIVQGFTFGEAAYAAQETLSWQTTVIGDPLYRPFGTPLQELIGQQNRAHSKWLEWSYVRAVNINILRGKRVGEMSAFLQGLPATKESAVLSEKLADLYETEGKPASAIENYESALKLDPSPMQRVRIRLELADKLIALDRKKDAATDLKALLEEAPEYAGKSIVEKKLQDLEDKAASSTP